MNYEAYVRARDLYALGAIVRPRSRCAGVRALMSRLAGE